MRKLRKLLVAFRNKTRLGNVSDDLDAPHKVCNYNFYSIMTLIKAKKNLPNPKCLQKYVSDHPRKERRRNRSQKRSLKLCHHHLHSLQPNKKCTQKTPLPSPVPFPFPFPFSDAAPSSSVIQKKPSWSHEKFRRKRKISKCS